MKKFTPLVMCMAFMATLQLHAQSDFQRHEVGISGGAGLSGLYYDVQGGENRLGFGGQVGLDYMFYFTPRFGIGTGVEFGFYNNKVTLDNGLGMSSIVSYDDCGSCDDAYLMRVYGFEEKQHTTLLNIPIVLQYSFPLRNENTSIYLRAGAKIGLPIITKSDVTIDRVRHSNFFYDNFDDDYWGWEDFDVSYRNNMKYSPTYKLKTSYSVTAEAGVNFRLTASSKMYVGAYFDYGLNNIKKNANRDMLIDIVTDTGCSSCGGELPSQLPAARSILELNKLTSGVRPLAAGLKVRFTFNGCKTPPAPAPEVIVRYEPAPVPPPAPQPVQEPAPVPVVVPAEPQLTAEEERILLTPVIYTVINRSTLDAGNQALVTSVADIMKKHDWLKLLIEGRTCDIDTEAYNLRLGDLRARAVADFLIKQGISTDRLRTTSLGESDPVVPNDSPENRALNRRADFRIIK